MKVLFLSNTARLGGGNRSLLLLAKTLQEVGHSPCVLNIEDGPLLDQCKLYDIPVVKSFDNEFDWRKPISTFRTIASNFRFLRSKKIDIIHANDLSIARQFLHCARITNIPLVVHVRFPTGKWYCDWVYRCIPKPDCFIFNSLALRLEMGHLLRSGSPKAAQHVVYNAVDLSAFQAISRTRVTETPTIGILAHLVPVKGIDDFLRMASELTTREFDAEYWIIGAEIPGSGYEQVLRKLTQDLKLEDRVTFLGHRDDVPDLLNQLDVVVCASTVEPFGRCLIEAMACAKPVVATRVGGIPEVVLDGETGILVSPKSPTELADAVQRLLGDSDLRTFFAMNGKKRVSDQFSSKAHVEQILDIYAQVLNAKKK